MPLVITISILKILIKNYIPIESNTKWGVIFSIK